MSPVFVEFPQKVRDWRYELDDAGDRLQDAFGQKLKRGEKRLEALTNRLSPVRLAKSVAKSQTRLALLKQRQASAAKTVLDNAGERLNVTMAALDALSPLAVLKRGFSIVETEAGEILRDAEQVKIKDKLKIRLANGKLEAEVLKTE
jgi:exodeoxyribonuclease VII large subunit